MFGKILRGITVAAGVGFAIGVAAGRLRRPRENSGRENSLDELHQRIEERSGDVEALRQQMQEYRQRTSGDMAVIQKSLTEFSRSVPAQIESIVTPRVDDLRLQLRVEMQQSLNTSLTTFERAIGDKVADRIAALEKVMLDQSALVTALSHRAIEADMNMERLISAVCRLCEGAGERVFTDAPAKTSTNGAARRQSEIPTLSASLA